VLIFHHQSVIGNIIQIVSQACVNAPEEEAIKTSDYNNCLTENYQFGSAVFGLR
jgi:hypothetical protein